MSEEQKIKKQIELEELLANYDKEDKVISSHERVEELKNSPQIPSMHVGIDGLNSILNGIQESEVIVVSGDTGEGKSLFCQSLTVNLEKAGIGCVWFPYELGDRQFLERFREEVPKFYLPRKLNDNGIDWVEQRIKEAKIKYDCKVVFIDHIGFLSDIEKKHDGKRFELESLIRKIKTIAKNENVAIFTMWHNRKNPTFSSNYEAGANDLKESSAIGQDSDTVLMIKRIANKTSSGEKDYNSGIAKITVVKNRRGGTIKKSVYLQINNKGYFEELPGYAEAKTSGF